MDVLKRLLIAATCLLITFVGFAQSRQITGNVISQNDNTPLQGVTVTNRNTNQQTQTDAKGAFSINAEKGHLLVLSYVGFGSQNVTVGDDNSVSVKLTPSGATLQDVVVVGYGTQKRANLTGAVSTINVNEQLGSRPITDVARGLQGSVPGLSITTPSGDIGTNPAITLRGAAGSINGPGAQPLILVDNVEMPDLRMINPNDIESISVLKDAASASIYGTRGAWGVILITTKSGKKGAERSQISYNNNFSYSKPTTMPEVASAAEGAEMALAAFRRSNSGLTSFTTIGMTVDETAIQKMRDWQAQYGGKDLGPEMVLGRDFEIRNGQVFYYRAWDPYEMYLRNWAPQQNHNLTLSGSNAKTGYTLGFGFLDQKGVLKVNPDKFQRFNANLGVNSSITNWLDARAKIYLSRATRTRPFYYSSDVYDPWYYLSRWPSYFPYGTYQGKPLRNSITEVEAATMTPIQDNFARIQVGGTIKITKGLTFDADYTYANNNGREHQTGGVVSGVDFWGGLVNGELPYRAFTTAQYDRAVLASNWNERNTVKAFATYNKDLGDHDFKLIGGTDVELYQYGSQRTERRGLLNPDMGQPNLAIGDQLVGSSAGHWSTMGYFSRINYAFKNKFLLELNGRYDGSSSFPVKDQWGFFPSASVGYVLTQEKFMDFANPVLSFFKLRGSYGSIGNQAVGSNRFISVMPTTSSQWLVGSTNMLTIGSGTNIVGYPGLVSPTLTWETVTTLDIGADARFFNNKFGASFDWYKRTTTDMITSALTVPSTLGIGAPVINFGELETKGWELTLDWNQKFDNGLNLNVTGVLSDFQERISKFGSNATKLLSTSSVSSSNNYQHYEGRVLGEIWGYETDRFFTADDFEKDATGNFILVGGKYVLKPGIATQTQWENASFFYGPGDIKYKDLNGDGKINMGDNTVGNPGDQRVIGNSTPRYQYGFRVGADWKGFDVNLFIQGVGSRQQWANGPVVIPGYRAGEAWYAHQLDYWTPQNQDAFYPRPTNAAGGADANFSKNFLPQTKYLLNMAYTRLKNVNIGYTIPASISKRAKLQTVRVYLSGENLLTIDRLDVPIDPEVNYTTDGLGDPNTFGRVYPYRKTFAFGLQVTL
ncbi:MAG TPA: TonB-dependent receptor [Flavisolibacter sp.]|nr:TonB-dependent receptor [Flavisolibacter sp.]